MTEKKTGKTGTLLQPTSFTEINRIHRQALSAKRGSIVVTAATAGEGVSTFAHIMALRSADNGQKTLLVDLNMRNAHLSDAFNADRPIWGLDSRQVNEPMHDLIQPVEGVNNLFFMPAPRDDDSVQFLRDVQRAQLFLSNLEHHFDHVVVDTTPVGAMNRLNADPVLLAAAATRTVLVFLAGVTPRDKIKKARDMLTDAGAQLDGLLVNDYRNPTLRDELLAFTDGLKAMNPGLSDWLRRKILGSAFLAD